MISVNMFLSDGSTNKTSRSGSFGYVFMGLLLSLPGQAAWAGSLEGRGSLALCEGPELILDTAANPLAKNTGSARVSQTGPSGETGVSAGPEGPGGGENDSPQVSLTGPSGDSQAPDPKPTGPTGDGAGSGQVSPNPAGDTPGSGQTPSGPTGGSSGSTQASSGPQAADQVSPGGTGAGALGVAGDQAGAVALPEIKAEGAVVIDGATGKMLYGKNETQRFYPASTTDKNFYDSIFGVLDSDTFWMDAASSRF